MNAIISTCIPILLFFVATTLLGVLYHNSRERDRFLAIIFLSCIGTICLEMILLQL